MRKAPSIIVLTIALTLVLGSCTVGPKVRISDLAGDWTSTSWTNSTAPSTEKGTMTMTIDPSGGFSMVQSPVTGGTNTFSGELQVANDTDLLVTMTEINGSPAPSPPLNKQVIEFTLSGNTLTLHASASGGIDAIIFTR
jgi:hypothetical protein